MKSEELERINYWNNPESSTMLSREENNESYIENKIEKEELTICEAIKQISWLSFPTLIYYLSFYMQQTVNLIFIGHTIKESQKKNALDGIGFSHLYINCTVISIVNGIISGFETIGANAFGSKKYYLLGIYFHRTQMIGFITAFILLLINYFFCLKIISLFGVDAAVINVIKKYIYILMIYVIFDLQYSLNFKYFNIIEKSHMNLIILLINLALHPLWCYIFITVLGYGIRGAAISLTISKMLIALSGTMYLLIVKPLPESIFFYNKDSFRGWWDYLKIALPTTFLMCSESWALEIMGLIAIWISKLDYTVHVLLVHISENLNSISPGFGMSASILVGRSLCENKIKTVKRYAYVTYFFGFGLMAFFSTIVLILRNYILLIFIDQKDVLSKGAEVIPLVFLVGLFEFHFTFFVCLFRGLNKEIIASIITFFNVYFIQITFSVLLGRNLKWGVYGIWFGSFIGYLSCSIILFIVLLFLDFDQIQKETLERVENDTKNLSQEKNK